MKILHIYKDYYPVVGGIENHIRILAEAQAAQGHQVTVLVTSRDGQTHVEYMDGVRVILASRLLNVSSAPLSADLFKRVGNLTPDIAHLHFPYPFGEMANELFGKSRATVLTYHSDIVRQRYSAAFYNPLLHRVLRRVKTIIATSPNYVETSPVLERWRDKCVVIPLAVPVASRPEACGEMMPNRADGAGSLLFVGRLRYYKGVNYLLQALPLIPKAHLTIVGVGPKEQEWRALAKSSHVDERVTWAGEVEDRDLPSYYAACDVFVLPCSERSEAFGTVQLEAMAACKPIVSCDVGTGVAWVNQNEVTGFVVAPKNPAALAKAITRLLDDEELRMRMGLAGRDRVEKEFRPEMMTERVERVYEEALR
jgi:rhamnosyl/mannosyltransferase